MAAAGNNNNRAELRRKTRRQFRYTASILADNSAPPVSCSISDISETGARLVLEKDTTLPDKFILLLTANGGALRHCRMVWRTGLAIGVEFPHGHA